MEKPEEFIALYNRLLNDLCEDEAVYFADAVHPEYQTKPACGWVKQGSHPAVKTTAGRARINIITHKKFRVVISRRTVAEV